MVETRLWFDLKQHGRKKSAWTDIDVLGISKDSVYIVQCKNWPENKPKILENQFNLMYEHAMETHKSLMPYRKRYYILACMECSVKTERKLREQLSNQPHYYFYVWKFEDMARELIWYVYKHCWDRSLKLDNPIMWLLRNLVWYELIIEKAWYSEDWESRPSNKVYSELWDKVEREAHTGRQYRESPLSSFIKDVSSRYLSSKNNV